MAKKPKIRIAAVVAPKLGAGAGAPPSMPSMPKIGGVMQATGKRLQQVGGAMKKGPRGR